MLDFSALMTVAGAFFIVSASPGPATLALAATSMRSGRATGMRFGLGLSCGLAFWGLIAATGLGAILQTSSHVLMALKVLGGAYLLWLAWGAARSSARPAVAAARPVDDRRSFRLGLLLNLSNPQAVFAWMATLALGLGSGSGAWQVAVATGLCVALGFLIYAFYALVLSTARVMGVYARVRRWIDGVVAGLFALAGFALIRSAFTRG